MSDALARFPRSIAFGDFCRTAERRGCTVGLAVGTELLDPKTHPHRELSHLTVSEGRTLLCRVPIDRDDLATAARNASSRLGWAR